MWCPDCFVHVVFGTVLSSGLDTMGQTTAHHFVRCGTDYRADQASLWASVWDLTDVF